LGFVPLNIQLQDVYPFLPKPVREVIKRRDWPDFGHSQTVPRLSAFELRFNVVESSLSYARADHASLLPYRKMEAAPVKRWVQLAIPNEFAVMLTCGFNRDNTERWLHTACDQRKQTHVRANIPERARIPAQVRYGADTGVGTQFTPCHSA
jgi:hypothetical protein